MKWQKQLWCGLGLFSLLWLTACGGDGGGGSKSPGGTNMNDNGTNQLAPASLAGKTLSFTTTASDNFSEPAGSTFTINFTDDTHFTYNPSPQNSDGTEPRMGTYTYDPNSATAVFTGTGLPDTTVTFNFTGPGTGTAHMTHPDGGTLDANFTQI
jgi:hypothetical protein